jgi:SAM-dependent methyltransferase
MSNNNTHKGHDRERSLDRAVYFSDNYFKFRQLCSFVHQIYDIHQLRPKSVLEIGVGNGFTSTFLKRAGYDVTTSDINPALEPDICCPLSELPSRLAGKSFDLVVCCEVLEHMPFEQFATNLKVLHALGDRLYLTLPNHRALIGFGWLPRLPKLSSLEAGSLYVEVPFGKQLQPMHYWEVGSLHYTSRKAILALLRQYYSSTISRRYALNPGHVMFYAHSAKSQPGNLMPQQ